MLDLGAWTHETARAQYRDAYNAYSRELDRHYHAYFATRADERGGHVRQAADIERALPPGWERLADQLPERVRHRHHLSGRSSQVLSLALLGAATALDFSVQWLVETLGPLPASDSPLVAPRFEFELPPDALNEQPPRVTAIDYLVETSKFVVCVEAKRGEEGMGRCSCPPGMPPIGACSAKVLARPLYWRAAYDDFALPDREPGRPCPISFGYQAIRLVAAARQLATGGRTPVLALLYDRENPAFSGAGNWPGWARILEHTLAHGRRRLVFRALSWQELLPRMPLSPELQQWARVKHRLA